MYVRHQQQQQQATAHRSAVDERWSLKQKFRLTNIDKSLWLPFVFPSWTVKFRAFGRKCKRSSVSQKCVWARTLLSLLNTWIFCRFLSLSFSLHSSSASLVCGGCIRICFHISIQTRILLTLVIIKPEPHGTHINLCSVACLLFRFQSLPHKKMSSAKFKLCEIYTNVFFFLLPLSLRFYFVVNRLFVFFSLLCFHRQTKPNHFTAEINHILHVATQKWQIHSTCRHKRREKDVCLKVSSDYKWF